MRLRSISAQAFRGIRDRVEVVVDGDAALVYGENGSGKTSLAEAFEWVLYGTVARKMRSASPSEFSGWRWIRSVHAQEEVPTVAEVQLVGNDGVVRVVTRSVDGRGERLTIDGREVRDLASAGIPVSAPKPALAQCEIQLLLHSEQLQRWQELSSLLGLGGLGALRRRLQEMRMASERHPMVIAARTTATRLVLPLTPRGSDPLAVDPYQLQVRAARFLGLAEDASWEAIAATARTEIAEIHRIHPRPAAVERLITTRVELQDAAVALRGHVGAVVNEAVDHRIWHRDNQRSAFLREGIELIDATAATTCPFCGEETLTAAVRHRLGEDVRRTADPPRDHRREVEGVVRQALALPGPVDADVAVALTDAVPGGELVERLKGLVVRQAAVHADKGRLLGLLDGFLATTERARRDPGDDGPLRSLAEQLVDLGTAIATVADTLRSEADELRIALEASLSEMTSERRARLDALQVAINLVDDVASVRRAWRIRELQQDLGGLIDGLEVIEKREMASALAHLSADIARHYETLSPGHHIRVTGITVRESTRRQAAIGATSYGRVVNPVTTFSEAEGNCLGLSLFFSQRVERNPAWDLLLLDDPVQSMDAGHEQALVQLLAGLSRGRQVIVFTHDRGFADAFDAQFSPLESYVRYNMERRADPQPRLELAAGRLGELLRFAEANAAGELAMREACSGALRKAVERFVHDVALAAGEDPPRRSQTIEQRIDWVRDRRLVEPLDSGTLHRLRRFGAPGAHDDPTANATTGAILANVAAMRELQGRYLERRAARLTVIEGGQRA